MYKKIVGVFANTIAVTGGTFIINSCVHQPYVLPVNMRTGDPTICFERDVLPIFQSNCAKSGCHDAGSHASDYVLDNYNDIVRKGIVPGNTAASRIWESMTIRSDEGGIMPMNAPSLSASELDVIRRWIGTGAIDSGACATSTCDTNNFTYSGAIAPLMQSHCTGCHNSSAAAGGSLMDYASVMNAAVNGRLIGDISHLAGYNAMPSGGTILDECQITQVKKWVAAGAPNN